MTSARKSLGRLAIIGLALFPAIGVLGTTAPQAAAATGGTWWYSADTGAGCSGRYLEMTYDGAIHTQGYINCSRPFSTTFWVTKGGSVIYQASESSTWSGDTYIVNRLKDFGACAHGNYYQLTMSYSVPSIGRGGWIASPSIPLC